MSKWLGSLLIASIVVGVIWAAMEYQLRADYRDAATRNGYTSVTLTGEFTRPGKRFPVMGFEGVDKNGARVTGWIVNEQGGVVRVDRAVSQSPSTSLAGY